MTLPAIAETRLLPRRVSLRCSSADSSTRGRTWGGEPCDGWAVAYLVADDDQGVPRIASRQCQRCLDATLGELQRFAPDKNWHAAPIYHDDDASHSLERPPELC